MSLIKFLGLVNYYEFAWQQVFLSYLNNAERSVCINVNLSYEHQSTAYRICHTTVVASVLETYGPARRASERIDLRMSFVRNRLSYAYNMLDMKIENDEWS